MEIDAYSWGLALIWGVVLGLFYFGGLWMTLRLLPRTGKPRVWLGVSYGVRVLVALLGFWMVVRKDPLAFLVCFLAFLITRTILTRTLGRGNREKHHATQP